MTTVKKWSFERHGEKFYYLGVDENGENYFLQEAHFDCGWYWGGGYVETFTNNKNPKNARDISSHQHFDWLFLKNPRKNGFDAFKDFFAKTPFTDSEIWKICELVESFYIARSYSDMIYRGCAHYSKNPAEEVIKNETEYKRINNFVIPAINAELYKILEG